MKYNIDHENINEVWEGEDRWRSYHLITYGNNLYEVIDNAQVIEIDDDGKELESYGIYDTSNKQLTEKCLDIIADHICRRRFQHGS